MFALRHKCSTVVCPTVIYSTGLLAGSNLHQKSSQTPTSAEYFPENTIQGMGNLLSQYFLRPAGELSLVAVAHNEPRAISYRFDWMGSTTTRLLAVRFLQRADGTAQVTAVQGKLGLDEYHETKVIASAADSQKFLSMVTDSDFWTMPAMQEPAPGPNGRRTYTLDGEFWIFEGARDGKYHMVYRHSPDPGSFTQMVFYLVKGLANLDDSSIPGSLKMPPTKAVAR